MELLAVSKDTIRAHVIRYFHDVFGTPISAFMPSTNVRKAYSYKDNAWRQLANVFNKLSWMRQLGALLAPSEMLALKTVDDLTNAIWGKLNKVVTVAALSTRLQVGNVKTFARPKRRSKKRPKTARNKTNG
jgi:hypothetical protein